MNQQKWGEKVMKISNIPPTADPWTSDVAIYSVVNFFFEAQEMEKWFQIPLE